MSNRHGNANKIILIVLGAVTASVVGCCGLLVFIGLLVPEGPKVADSPAVPKQVRPADVEPDKHGQPMPEVIPGTTPAELVKFFTDRDYDVRGPEPVDDPAGLAWTLRDRGNDDFTVRVIGNDRETVRLVEARVANPIGPNDKHASASLVLSLVAGIPYDGADSRRASNWAFENYWRDAQTVIGGVQFDLKSDTPKTRLLTLRAAGERSSVADVVKADPPAVIPGLKPVDVYGNLTGRGFSKEGPKFIGGILPGTLWILRNPGEDRDFRVTITGNDANTVRAILATGMIYGPLADFANVSREFLGFVASVPYDGAKPAEARRWVEANVGTNASTVIAGVRFELFAPKPKRTHMLLIKPEH